MSHYTNIQNYFYFEIFCCAITSGQEDKRVCWEVANMQTFRTFVEIRNTMKRIAQLLIALCLVACGTINEELPTYEESSIINVGDYAPDFSATTLSGEIFSLSAHEGDIVLLILFSHTCPDCKSLFDDVMLYKDDIERLGATTIAVSRGGSTEDIEAYMNLHGYTFDAIADGEAAIYRLYATTYVPRTYLINHQGLVEFTTIEYSSTYLPQILEQIARVVE